MAIAHLTLATRDVGGSADFFTETLGWQPIHRPNNIDREAAWLAIGEGQELHLVHVDNFQPSPYEKEFGRHLAIDYPLDGFPELKERLKSNGADIIAPERPTPFARFFFRDPNGYMFEVVDSDRSPEN